MALRQVDKTLCSTMLPCILKREHFNTVCIQLVLHEANISYKIVMVRVKSFTYDTFQDEILGFDGYNDE